MKTAIAGKVRLKLFWRSTYSGCGMMPVQRLCKIGNLILAKVVYAKNRPSDYDYYKYEVMRELRKHYDVRWELAPHSAEDFWHCVYSSRDEGYVGTPEDAYRFLQRGITDIQKAHKSHKTCSIGYSPAETKWYGWSHRAMFGFTIGDVVKEGDCCASSGWTKEYLEEHPEEDRSLPVGFKAKSMVDAMKMAIAFAESVS